MNKKAKLRYKAVLSLILSAVLFCMPAVAFSMNGNNAIDARAEDSVESGMREETENTTEESHMEHKEGENLSGNDAETVCTCEKKCSVYDFNRDCKVCAANYKDCDYKTPNVVININSPGGWYNKKASVTFSVSDTAHTGNFEAAKIQAKIGQNGSWTDVTEDKKLEISENCTVYVQVTDQKGNTYERSRAVRCFDTTKPTLNAAVSDGLLSIQVHDMNSGAKAVYVNGYEFTDLTGGTLNINLQQFDAGYEYFTISAMDNAGNMSEVYKTKNPYYKDPADESDENPAKQLPINAEATKPGNATGRVTEHTRVDSDGNTVSENSLAEQKKRGMAEAIASEKKEEFGEKEKSKTGKEFYTIQTASEKVFYLIIDQDGEEEMVYFLTEVTENDLLNVTAGNSETLPKNSAALESAIPVTDGALPNNNGGAEREEKSAEEPTEDGEEENTEEPEPEPEKAEENPMATYIILGIVAVAAIGGGYYFKVVRKKKEEFLDEDDEEEDEEEKYEDDEENEDNEDDFFEDKEGEDE